MSSNNESIEKNSIHSNNKHHIDDIKDDFSELGILSVLSASLLEIDDQKYINIESEKSNDRENQNQNSFLRLTIPLFVSCLLFRSITLVIVIFF
jgi:hypothetical protein